MNSAILEACMPCCEGREQRESAWWTEIFSGHGISKGLAVRLEEKHQNKGELTSSASWNYTKKVAQRQNIERSLLKNRLLDCITRLWKSMAAMYQVLKTFNAWTTLAFISLWNMLSQVVPLNQHSFYEHMT